MLGVGVVDTLITAAFGVVAAVITFSANRPGIAVGVAVFAALIAYDMDRTTPLDKVTTAATSDRVQDAAMWGGYIAASFLVGHALAPGSML